MRSVIAFLFFIVGFALGVLGFVLLVAAVAMRAVCDQINPRVHWPRRHKLEA